MSGPVCSHLIDKLKSTQNKQRGFLNQNTVLTRSTVFKLIEKENFIKQRFLMILLTVLFTDIIFDSYLCFKYHNHDIESFHKKPMKISKLSSATIELGWVHILF